MKTKSLFQILGNAVPLLTSNEKLPMKASNSLPEFFQEEFPTFQKFIDYYYQYQIASREGYKNISSIKDIDEIGRKYLEAFYKMYANKMPVFPYMGMADFIRNAKKFYVSRGSEDSFRFLFRVMFGEEIDFKYPKENMFIPSSGKWSQKVSIYVKITEGSVTDTLIGKKLLIRAINGTTTTLTVKGYSDLGDDVWEIEVEKFNAQTVFVGAKVFSDQDPLTLQYRVKGDVESTLNDFEVLVPGEGFLVGQVFNVSTLAGELSFRITAVDENTGIKRIEFLSFGERFSGQDVITVQSAEIKLISTSVNRYSGYYDNTDGFASNNSKLQDSYFYQIFSYVIKSRVTRDLYEDLMLRILHPTGLIMFSEFEGYADHKLDISLGVDISHYIDVIEVVNIYDEFNRQFEGFRSFSDPISIQDSFQINTQKFFTDSVSVADEGTVEYWEAGTYTEEGYCVDMLYTIESYSIDAF